MRDADVHSAKQAKDGQDSSAEWAEINAHLDSLLDSLGKSRPNFHASDTSPIRNGLERQPPRTRRYSTTPRRERNWNDLLTSGEAVGLFVSLAALTVSLFPIATWSRILAGLAGVAGLATSLSSNSSDSRQSHNWGRDPRNRRLR